MEIQFEKHELANGETHFTFVKGIAYDERGNQLHFESFDRDYLEGLACLTGNQVTDYCEGKYLPSGDNKKAVCLYTAGRGKVVKKTISLSMKQVRGLLHLGFTPYYVKNSGTADAKICYL